MLIFKLYDCDLDNVDGNGDGVSDVFRMDFILYVNRLSLVCRLDSSGYGLVFQYGSRLNLIFYLGIKEDDVIVNWNGSRSYSFRRSLFFDVFLDNNLGCFYFFLGQFCFFEFCYEFVMYFF